MITIKHAKWKNEVRRESPLPIRIEYHVNFFFSRKASITCANTCYVQRAMQISEMSGITVNQHWAANPDRCSISFLFLFRFFFYFLVFKKCYVKTFTLQTCSRWTRWYGVRLAGVVTSCDKAKSIDRSIDGSFTRLLVRSFICFVCRSLVQLIVWWTSVRQAGRQPPWTIHTFEKEISHLWYAAAHCFCC